MEKGWKKKKKRKRRREGVLEHPLKDWKNIENKGGYGSWAIRAERRGGLNDQNSFLTFQLISQRGGGGLGLEVWPPRHGFASSLPSQF